MKNKWRSKIFESHWELTNFLNDNADWVGEFKIVAVSSQFLILFFEDVDAEESKE